MSSKGANRGQARPLNKTCLDEFKHPCQPAAGLPSIPLPYTVQQGSAGPASIVSLKATPFAIRVKDSRLYCPSAMACLFLPAYLGETVHITSTCPTYGSEISLTVTTNGVLAEKPAGCVLSVPLSGRWDGRAGELMRFFSSQQAAAIWLVAYPDVLALEMQQAWQLAMDLYADWLEGNPADDREEP